MTIDRAIEILNPEHRENYKDLNEVNEACRMGMEALERSKWIPCSERLPEKDGAYLVAGAKVGWIGVKQFSKRKTLTAGWGQQVDTSDAWWELDEDDYPVWCPFVTHWMPLPEPPEEEEQNGR